MVAAEAAACGCPPLVARHSGLAEVAAGLEAGLPASASATWRRSRPATSADLRAKLAELLALPAADRDALREPRRGGRRRALVVGGRRCAPARARSRNLRGHGRGTAPFSPRSSSRPPARRSRAAPTSRVAVEEEFALLDPETLDARRTASRRCRRPRAGTERRAAPRRRADRVRGRGAHGQVRRLRRGGRDDGRAARAAPGARARPRARARRDRHAPVEPLAGPADHRHAALPPERRAPPLRRLAQQHLRAARPRRHPRRRPRDRASATRCAASCPSCSRCRRARRSSRRSTAGCTRRARRSSRACSRAAGSRTPTTAGRGSRTTSRSSTGRGSIDEHTQLWWSVRPHLAYPTVEIRICDAQPDLAEAQSARGARLRARRPLRAGARRGRAAARPAAPAARGEPLARDPLRASPAS